MKVRGECQNFSVLQDWGGEGGDDELESPQGSYVWG